jgi:hypothetical protein
VVRAYVVAEIIARGAVAAVGVAGEDVGGRDEGGEGEDEGWESHFLDDVGVDVVLLCCLDQE